VIRSYPFVVECTPGAVVLPAVDLDGQFQFGIGEIDPAAPCASVDAVLLDGLRETTGNHGARESHLEIAVARLVAGKSTPQHGRDAHRATPGRRREPCIAFPKVIEVKLALPKCPVGHTSELG